MDDIEATLRQVRKLLPNCNAFLSHGNKFVIIQQNDNIYGFLRLDDNRKCQLCDNGSLLAVASNDGAFVPQGSAKIAKKLKESNALPQNVEITLHECILSLYMYDIDIDDLPRQWSEYARIYQELAFPRHECEE